MKLARPKQPVRTRALHFTNLQRVKRLNSRALKLITEAALVELAVDGWDLNFYLIGTRRMTAINHTHMQHEGSTDVITFDYGENLKTRNLKPQSLLGEVFVCVDVAVTQAREFRTTWQSEVVRYIVHALLHLCGHDDLRSADRRVMKRREDELVRQLASRFDFGRLLRK